MKVRNYLGAGALAALVAGALVLLGATVVGASGVDESIVDVTVPVSSVTLAPGTSGAITINLSVTGKQDGTATFDVYRNWTLSGGTFVGSTPQTFTVPPRASGGGPATTFSTSGSVTVAASQPVGTFTLAVGAFNFTNSNSTGAKLGAGAPSSYQVTVSPPPDSAPPVLTLPATITEEAANASGAVVSYTATANDAVDGPITPSCSPVSGSTFPIGDTTVNCSATDAHNNTATGSFKVSVTDTSAPVVTVPADITTEATGPGGAVVDYTTSASDLVDGPLTATCDSASGSTFALGTTTVTCSATDAHGNTGSTSFTVTVQDTTAPTLTVSGNQTAEATGPDGAAVSYAATASDLVDGAVNVSCSPNSGSTFALGTTTVTCSATDTHGNTGSASFTVTVHDTTPPTLTVPSDITEEATGPAGAVVTYAASASDLVDGSVTPACTPAPGSSFALGTATVTCTATDAASNTSTDSFLVTVQDTTAPALSLPNDITAEATGSAGAVVTYTASASDLVDGSVTPACTPASGSTFALGTATVTCTATDKAGNTASDNFDVTVQDTTAPALSLPTNITASATSNSQAVVNYTAAASDLVDGPVTPSCSPASGSTFSVGTTTVTCSATDNAGNTATGSFTVTVNYGWTGFFQPIDNNGVANKAKAGSTIPVKFSLGGNQGLAILAAGYPKAVPTTVSASVATDAIEDYSTATVSALKYDATANQYIYNWKTDSSWVGKSFLLTVKLADGSMHTALFTFTK